ncbi:uncharacterized protein BJ212DRAFT_1361281 [Suillus subaureus]|uniref:Uncharacterized protein n=1 Tax=Suillus subaureus TaxID=48587 RepID=A0A9P7E9F5_9AGAM|nr:uncharacterized protein BJ212DRAFT_1361281 [Suillus subaureus]KAG1814671.1 hypothetical protein BJ212DRAFT_1361281 [Suillus subaureus]
MWNCTPPLPDIPLSRSLFALGLRFSLQGADPSLEPHILPQFLLARPDLWQVQHRIVEALLNHSNLGSAVGGESQRKWEPFVFEDANDDFHFLFSSFSPKHRTTDCLIFKLIPSNSFSNLKVKHVLVPSRPLTSEDERRYTPQFSPSAFFRAIDEFRSGTEDTNPDSWHIGEVVSSTQTLFRKNPSFLRAFPSPTVSLAHSTFDRTWQRFKGSSSVPDPIILPSTLIFIQYLYALAIIDMS